MSVPGSAEFDPPNDIATQESSRTRNFAVGGVAVVLLAVLAGFFLWPDEEAPAPTTTTTTTSTTTTTTTIAELPGGTFELATAKAELERIKVYADEPDGWPSMQLALITDTPEPPPASQAMFPARVPLPTPEAPIAGRYAVEGGWEFVNPGPYEPRQPFTMVVTERRGQWAKVMVPLRPNGTQGWVDTDDVEFSTTTHRLEVSVGERMLRAYDETELIAETAVVVGGAFTQTPTGLFYVTDIVPQTQSFYGPVALALNSYSEQLDEFDNGVPVVALHGTSRPEQVGQAISNGCIRVPNDVIQMLADTVPQGTPVYITP